MNSDKLCLRSFQYAIRVADIPKLFAKVALTFKPLIEVNAMDAIKNTAPLFGATDFLHKRGEIEAMFLANVTKAISQDLFVNVADLQLRKVGMTPELQTTKLTAAIQAERNGKQVFIQQKVIFSLSLTHLHLLDTMTSHCLYGGPYPGGYEFGSSQNRE